MLKVSFAKCLVKVEYPSSTCTMPSNQTETSLILKWLLSKERKTPKVQKNNNSNRYLKTVERIIILFLKAAGKNLFRWNWRKFKCGKIIMSSNFFDSNKYVVCVLLTSIKFHYICSNSFFHVFIFEKWKYISRFVKLNLGLFHFNY